MWKITKWIVTKLLQTSFFTKNAHFVDTNKPLKDNLIVQEKLDITIEKRGFYAEYSVKKTMQ